jgi:tetratricopeptide (TPR) repeat protein
VWHARRQIVDADAAASQPHIDDTLRDDLLDLAVIWANLQIRLAPADGAREARQNAAQLLDEAQQLLGSSLELELAKRENGTPASLDPSGQDAAIAPKTVWEHYAVGRSLYRRERFAEARREFRDAIRLEPSAFWPNFYLELCAYRLEDFDEALNAASVCVVLSPRSSECFYNRALAQQALGHQEAALADFSQALEPPRRRPGRPAQSARLGSRRGGGLLSGGAGEHGPRRSRRGAGEPAAIARARRHLCSGPDAQEPARSAAVRRRYDRPAPRSRPC